MPLLRRVLAPLIAREVTLHLRHRGFRTSIVCLRYHARAYGSAQGECEDKDEEKIGARSRLDFSNTEEAFRSKKFSELLRHYLVYRSFSFNKLVDKSPKLISTSQRVLGRRLFNWLMKRTLYGQFVAGEDLESVNPVISRYRASGIRSILDYAVEEDIGNQEVEMETRRKHPEPPESPSLSKEPEAHPQFKTSRSPGETTFRASARTYFYEGEEKCDQNKEYFISCIDTAADATGGDDAFAAIKITGLGRPELLLRWSEVVVEMEKIFLRLADTENILEALITPESFHRGMAEMGIELTQSESERLFRVVDADKTGKLNLFEWSNHFQLGKELHSLFLNKGYKARLTLLDEGEKMQMESLVERAKEVAHHARKRGVHLMVDAEQTYLQPAIGHITVNLLMPEYNLSKPVIYNTIQCYRKDAEKTLQMDLKLSQTTGFCYGVKLVRGAYMEQERHRAEEKGYEDPIWPSKNDTDTCYHHLLELLLNQVKPGKLNVMVATHNEETVLHAVDKMWKYGIDKSDGTVVFGQLLGMCDHVTFTLGQTGYHAYKYMPYGPVQDVVPYLLRRVNENRGILAGAKRDRELVGKEIWRRLSGGK